MKRVAGRVGLYATVIAFAAILAFPFYWMLLATFKTDRDLYDLGNNPLIFNDHLTLANLSLLFKQTLYVTWLANTAIVGVLVVAITLVLARGGGFTWAVTQTGQTQTIQGQSGYKDDVLVLTQQEGPPLAGKVGNVNDKGFGFQLLGDPKAPTLAFAR